MNQFARHTGPILEIGPGDGYFGEICLSVGSPYIAVERETEIGRRLIARGFPLIQASVPPIPVGEEKVAVCCLFHVLEHMADVHQAIDLIMETRRVLIPEGFLIVACPNYDIWGRDFFEDYTHNYITNPRRVGQLLADSGFRILKTQLYSGPVFGGWRYGLLLANRLLYWRWLNRLLGGERYYNGFLTFLECSVVVARKEK